MKQAIILTGQFPPGVVAYVEPGEPAESCVEYLREMFPHVREMLHVVDSTDWRVVDGAPEGGFVRDSSDGERMSFFADIDA